MDEWALDRVWNGIDENYKLAEFIANSSFDWPANPPVAEIYERFRFRTWGSLLVLAGWELRRVVNQVYGLQLSEAIAKYVKKSGELLRMLRALHPDDVVASTNYDLLAEAILANGYTESVNCRGEADARARRGNHGPLLLKLHGSLDWDFVSGPDGECSIERSGSGGPMATREIDYDAAGCEHRPLIVAPVRFKDDMLIQGTQPAALVEALTWQWRQLINAISKAEELVVLGYRFPSDDAYGNRMLQEGVRRRPDGRPLRTRESE